jgi:hypothetical protein
MRLRTMALAQALLIGLLASPATIAAQITAFKRGEVTTGMTKQCIYNGLGSTYTLTLSSISLCPLSVSVPTAPVVPSSTPTPSYAPPPPATITAFYKGEQTTGMTKQCYYDAIGSLVTRTLSAVALCPLSIQTHTGP